MFKSPVFWLLVSIVFYAYGEYLSKLWAFKPTFWMTCYVVMIYALGVVGWLPAIYLRNEVVVVGMLWELFAMISTVIIGCACFGEQLGPAQWTGIALALIASFLLTH